MVAMETGERLTSSAEVKTTLQRLAETIRRKEYRAGLDNAPPIPGPTPVPTPGAGITRRGLLIDGLKLGGLVAAVVGVPALCVIMTPHHPFAGVGPPVPPSPGVARNRLIYQGHKGPITALSWSPDGKMVASGSADKTVQVWRAADGQWLYTYYGYASPVTSVVWATDRANEIASAGQNDGTVQIWNALMDHTYLNLHGDGRVLALSWKEKSPWIVSGGTAREIYTWNASSGKKGASYSGHKGEVRTVTWLPDMPESATPGSVTSGCGVKLNQENLPEKMDVSAGQDHPSPEALLRNAAGSTAGVRRGWPSHRYAHNSRIAALIAGFTSKCCSRKARIARADSTFCSYPRMKDGRYCAVWG